MTFDSSADVGAWDDGDSLGNPLLRGRGTTTDSGFVDDGSGNFPSDDEEDASSRSSMDERGRLGDDDEWAANSCLLYTSPSPRDRQKSRMPSSA